jgi:predicted membrane-bound mannosyltransferase
MKSPMIGVALAIFPLTVTAQEPVSATQRYQRSVSTGTAARADQAPPNVLISAVAARPYSFDDGGSIAIRLQDAHHGDGPM